MTKLTRAAKTKIVEGYNREVEHGDSQYKFRRGTYASRGGDIARRHNLRHCLESGKPIQMSRVNILGINDILKMESTDDQWFSEQSGIKK